MKIPDDNDLRIYVCSCGFTFELWADGRVECRSCGMIMSQVRWRFEQDEPKDTGKEG